MKWLRYLLLLLPMTVIAQPIGEVDTAGTTYASFQHHGSCGRMIVVDGSGNVHLVWCNWYNPWGNPSFVYYNKREPSGEWLYDGGIGASMTFSAHAPNLAGSVDEWVFPAFGAQYVPEGVFRAIVTMDLLPGAGAFEMYPPAMLYENGSPVQMSWPKIARMANGDVLVISAEYSITESTPRLFYSRGVPDTAGGFGSDIVWDELEGDAEFALLDTAMSYGHTIAAAHSGSRVAVAYLRPVGGFGIDWQAVSRDVYVKVSEDGGQTWAQAENITHFTPPDMDCFADTDNGPCCRRDTLRAGEDISLLFDNGNQLHAAFTTYRYQQWDSCGEGPQIDRFKAILWHWTGITDSITEIAEEWTADSLINPATQPMPLHYMVERPSLAINRTTGALYCTYLQFDREEYSEAGYLNADVFASVSVNNGTDWSVGGNVTNTPPTVVPAPPGENRIEQDVTVAEAVYDNALHLSYLLDVNGDPMPEGGPLENSFIYHRITTESISVAPLLASRPFHVVPQNCESVSFPVGDPERCQVVLEDDTLIANGVDSTQLRITVVNHAGDTLGAGLQLAIVHTGQGTISPPEYIGGGVYSFRIVAPVDSGVDMLMVNQAWADCHVWLGAAAIRYVRTTGVRGPSAGIPATFALCAPQPNPFNSSTTIKFDLPRRMAVELTVFDVLGREVEVLHNGVMSAGQHQLTWSPNVGSGVYFLRLKAGTQIRCEKLMFLR